MAGNFCVLLFTVTPRPLNILFKISKIGTNNMTHVSTPTSTYPGILVNPDVLNMIEVKARFAHPHQIYLSFLFTVETRGPGSSLGQFLEKQKV